MAWVRGDDQAKDNPRVLRSGIGGFLRQKTFKSRQMERCCVFGFVALCVAWSAGKYTDLFLPEYLVYDVGGEDSDWLVAAAIKAGFLSDKLTDERSGDEGWQVIDNGDNLFHVRTFEEVQLARDVDYNSRLSIPNLQVAARDGDQCRYCLQPVKPLLRKGGDNQSDHARTVDHVRPEDPETDRVVACRKCNTRKARRTPEQAGMRLYDPPQERGAETYYHPKTVATFRAEGYEHLLRLPKRSDDQSNDQSESEATSEATPRPKRDRSEAGVGSDSSPGRDGRSGLVGSGGDGPGPDQVGPVPGPAEVRPLRPVRDGDEGGAT